MTPGSVTQVVFASLHPFLTKDSHHHQSAVSSQQLSSSAAAVSQKEQEFLGFVLLYSSMCVHSKGVLPSALQLLLYKGQVRLS